MTVKQLSVFLENKSGRLTEVLQALGESKISITALTIADTSEYGVLRLIVADQQKAYNVLKEKGFTVQLSDVLCIATSSEAGSFASALQVLSDENISVEYMYAFSLGNKAALVIRTESRDKAIAAAQKGNLTLIQTEDLIHI